MIGQPLGRFEMHVGYLTVTFTVTKPSTRPISIWRQGGHLVAELDPSEVDKPHPWVRYKDLAYSAEMSHEWKEWFKDQVVRIWRHHHDVPTEPEPVDESANEVTP
ncbi:MAG: hypothetical protein ACRD0P_27515 [Stackebrandtia sp.]